MNGKVVVVTGGFGSLGQAVVRRLQAGGARVAVLDQAQPSPTMEGSLFLGGINLADGQNAVEAIHQAAASLGGVDALVNIAGTFRWEPLQGGSLETWDLLYQVNLRTAVSATQAALPHLLQRGAGRIINIGAASAAKAGIGVGAYAASKAGIAKLTESLAEELKDRSITVNAILPSIIDTIQNRQAMPDAEFDRWVSPDDIARVIVFLLSDDASAITGALIPVVGRL